MFKWYVILFYNLPIRHIIQGGDFVAKDESEETLHSSNNQTEGKDNNLQDLDSQFVQEVIRLQFEGETETNKKPRCNDEELLNLSLDQDENTKAVKLTQEVRNEEILISIIS